MGRVIIYGDIHGCLDEWKALRSKIGAGAGDSEFCVGDLLSKGPKPLETLRFAKDLGIKVTLGNHEEKYIEIASAKGNYAIGLGKYLDFFKTLGKKDLDFLFSLPRFIKIANVVVIHAGLTNSIDLDKLNVDQYQILTRLRYVSAGDADYSFWSELYNGNQGFAVYGHTPGEIRRDKYALGIDTGCVYGYQLSAAIFEWHGKLLDTDRVKIAQINAIKEYA